MFVIVFPGNYFASYKTSYMHTYRILNCDAIILNADIENDKSK